MTTNQQLDKLCMEHFGNRKYVADGIFHESAESRWEMEKPKVLFVMKQPNSNNLLGEDYRTYELHDVLLGNQNWSNSLRVYMVSFIQQPKAILLTRKPPARSQ